MANRPSSSRPNSGRGNAAAGGRRRTPPPQVKKPFPWGVAITSGVLGLLLLGILGYAITNAGSGAFNPLREADKKVADVQKSDEKRDHVATTVDYPKLPPAGGPHNSVPQSCAVYTAPIANEHAVHSLEHGAVWVTYRPDLPAAQVATLKAKVEGDPYRLLSPFPGLKSAVSLQAWGRQIFVDSADDPKVEAFLEAYTNGPQKPENGACEGNTTTGPLQVAPQATTTVNPSPGGSGVPSPPPAPAASGSAK